MLSLRKATKTGKVTNVSDFSLIKPKPLAYVLYYLRAYAFDFLYVITILEGRASGVFPIEIIAVRYYSSGSSFSQLRQPDKAFYRGIVWLMLK